MLKKTKKRQLSKTAKNQKAIAKRADYCLRISNKLANQKRMAVISEQKKYELLVKNATDKVQAKYAKKLERRLAKIERLYEQKKNRLIKTKVYKKEVKPILPQKKTIKQKALAEFCRYCKLSRAEWMNDEIKVYAVDKQLRLPIGDTQGGHAYSKTTYPHLAFEMDNCRPITPMTNKRQ